MSDLEVQPAPGNPGRALAAVGHSEAEEGTYLVLLEHPGATSAEIADLAGLPQQRAGRVLSALESKGMVTRSLDRDARFRPTPPDAAVEALIAVRQQQLSAVRCHAQRLAEQVRSAARRRGGHEIVEMVSGPGAVTCCRDRVLAAVRKEGLVFVRSPVAGREGGELAALARGVLVRAVYDRNGLERSGALDGLRAHVAAGERARVYSPLPVELIIADQRTAMIPLVTGTPDSAALLLRPSGLLDALVLFFETVWRQATPFTVTAAGEIKFPEAGGEEMPPDLELILPLLAVGLRDDCIARELGVSARTLDRRLRSMMHAFNAATRFQAGWIAAGKYHPLPTVESRTSRRRRRA